MIVLLLLGLTAGVLSGMAAGGGTILVPGLVLLLGLPQHRAQAAVLAAFFATQTAAVYGQWRQGKIRWRAARWMVAGSAVGAVAGALLAVRTRPLLLRELYGWYLILLGIANWVGLKKRLRV